MGKIFFFVVVFGTAGIALFRPWIGVAVAYLFVILTPQNIWWWNFDELRRPVYWILLPTFAGFIIAWARGKLNFKTLKNKRILYFAILWFCFIISYFFGSYVDAPSSLRLLSPANTLLLINKIFILFMIACVCIDDEKKLKYLTLVLVVSVVYLIYWANAQYLFHGKYGRIGGPTGLHGGSIYTDENTFAMLFVTGLPFLYYLGFYFKNKIVRYGIWLVIPFGWHAIFLTGSRGGLVGLLVTLLVIALRSPKKIIGILILPAFLIAYVWQAGDVMKSRTHTIIEYEEESSAASRIDAWDAALKMIISHPVTGVGLSSFLPAFPDYSDKQPRIAHNTFLQISAESGVIAGLMYLFIILLSFIKIWKRSKNLKMSDSEHKNTFLFLLNEAIIASLSGLVICSLFLSLHVYEIFFFLCILINSTLIINNEIASPPEQPQTT